MVEGKSLSLLAKLPPVLFKKGTLLFSVLNPQVRRELLSYLKVNDPDLYGHLSSFLSKGELLLTLLLLLEPRLYKRVKPYLPGEVNRERIRELIGSVVASLFLFSTLNLLLIPISGKGFEGRVLFGSYQGMEVALIEGQTPLGEFLALVRAVGSSVSVELSGDERLVERLREEELFKLLEEEGLKPVSVRKVERERIEEVKGKLLKGSLVEFSA